MRAMVHVRDPAGGWGAGHQRFNSASRGAVMRAAVAPAKRLPVPGTRRAGRRTGVANGEVQLLEGRLVRRYLGEPSPGRGQGLDKIRDASEVVDGYDRGAAVSLVAGHAGQARQSVEHSSLLGVEDYGPPRPDAANQVIRRSGQQVATRFEHDDLVGQPFRLEQQVRAHDDGLAPLGHVVDEGQNRVGRLGIETRCRLI